MIIKKNLIDQNLPGYLARYKTNAPYTRNNYLPRNNMINYKYISITKNDENRIFSIEVTK